MPTADQLLLTAIFLPLIASPFLFLGAKLKEKTGWICLLVPLVSLLSLVVLAVQGNWQADVVYSLNWIPSLGINLSFLFDGLSLFYGLIVSGVGLLVTFYSIFYLGKKYDQQNRYYSYLMLFMGSMLGCVFADNLMVLFVFWELTGLASFFLIGYPNSKLDCRRGARMALIVTASTGLVLLIGVVLTISVTNTFSLKELMDQPHLLARSPELMNAALLCLMLGAFGKSAQFPFHFWLPNAMAAPTPVSAYLHSATMVKLGLFLCARLYPIFSPSEWWMPLLVTVAFATLLTGSILGFLSHDLKAILAYSTVAQLGFIIGIYGLQEGGVQHDYFHVLNHVFYKGALFMIAGIVEHTAHTRDIRELGGLFRTMPATAIACVIAALAMAGFPFTSGFISKELMLAEIFGSAHRNGGAFWLLPLVMGTSAVLMIAFSIRFFRNIFWQKKSSPSANLHRPSFFFQFPVFILTAGVLLCGIFPGTAGEMLANLSVTGLQNPSVPHLSLWHGVNAPLGFGLFLLGTGTAIYLLAQIFSWRFARIPQVFQFDHYFWKGYHSLIEQAGATTRFLRSHRPFDYLPIIISGTLLMIGILFFYHSDWNLLAANLNLAKPQGLETFVSIVIIMAAFGTVLLKRRVPKLISLSVTGLMITFYFVLYRAPDLALTQILIETVSLILILLFFTRLPVNNHDEGKFYSPRSLMRFFLSGLTGILTFLLIVFFAGNLSPQKIGGYFIENTTALAQGNNAVNTILVDFRGYDTMGEITVLVIAMLGVLGLLMNKYRPATGNRMASPSTSLGAGNLP